MSDHQYITFELEASRNGGNANPWVPRGWKTDGEISSQDMEIGLLLARWTGERALYAASANAEQRARAFQHSITAACDFALRRLAPCPPGKPPAFWWNAEIASKRRDCVAAKRAKTRCIAKVYLRRSRGQNSTSEEEAVIATNDIYKEARKGLKNAIAQSKTRSWNELLATIDCDPWGKPYKLVARKLQGSSPTSMMECESVRRITDVLFPLHQPMTTQVLQVNEMPPPSQWMR